jgi:hypothetical protein
MSLFGMNRLVLLMCTFMTIGRAAKLELKGNTTELVFNHGVLGEFALSVDGSGVLSFPGAIYVTGDVTVASTNTSFIALQAELAAIRVELQTLQEYVALL